MPDLESVCPGVEADGAGATVGCSCPTCLLHLSLTHCLWFILESGKRSQAEGGVECVGLSLSQFVTVLIWLFILGDWGIVSVWYFVSLKGLSAR